MGRLSKIVATLFTLLLTACQTLPGSRPLKDAIGDPAANRVPVTRLATGLLSIPITFADGTTAPFIIDTGATMSVVFADRADRIGTSSSEQVRIHGMFDSQLTTTTTIPDISLGSAALGDVRMAVLPARRVNPTPAWGIIGMDLLERFRLYLPKGEDMLFLFALDSTPVSAPAHWSTVDITPNPYADTESGRRLRFMDIRVSGRSAPALLDSGSSFSVMSYHFAELPQLKWHRKQTKRRYKIEGALDTYRPTLRIQNIDFRAGSRLWRGHSFVVQEMESLDILGLEDQPFIIAGINLFKDESLYIDFSENVLRMPQTPDVDGKRNVKTARGLP